MTLLEHERVHLISDPRIGLQAVIAIHSTALGPALGGMRMWHYEEGWTAGLEDALRLSRAMTLKASAAGLDLGGGKTVVLDDGAVEQRPARLRALAGELERLGGSYITAEDVGTTTADMDFLAKHTDHVVGRSARDGIGGDPSPITARGVLGAIRAALDVLDGSDELAGRSVGVLGLGKVGGPLAEELAAAGAYVVGFDPAPATRARFAAGTGIELVDAADALLARELDVLAPCALGGAIDERVAGALRCRIVCGAANNPLAGEAVAALLDARGILYVPDFLANCGGLIGADAERRGAGADVVEEQLTRARARTRKVLAEARETGELPVAVAEQHARERIARAIG